MLCDHVANLGYVERLLDKKVRLLSVVLHCVLSTGGQVLAVVDERARL